MQIRELGGTVVVVAGGAIYGISQVGLGAALSEDIRHISEFTMAERPAYMTEITTQFSEAFDAYYVATESDYVYEGHSTFSIAPSSGTFTELVRNDASIPEAEFKEIVAVMATSDFCAQEEMVIFTDKGWKYSFKMQEATGRKIFEVTCKPARVEQDAPALRGLS